MEIRQQLEADLVSPRQSAILDRLFALSKAGRRGVKRAGRDFFKAVGSPREADIWDVYPTLVDALWPLPTNPDEAVLGIAPIPFQLNKELVDRIRRLKKDFDLKTFFPTLDKVMKGGGKVTQEDRFNMLREMFQTRREQMQRFRGEPVKVESITQEAEDWLTAAGLEDINKERQWLTDLEADISFRYDPKTHGLTGEIEGDIPWDVAQQEKLLKDRITDKYRKLRAARDFSRVELRSEVNSQWNLENYLRRIRKQPPQLKYDPGKHHKSLRAKVDKLMSQAAFEDAPELALRLFKRIEGSKAEHGVPGIKEVTGGVQGTFLGVPAMKESGALRIPEAVSEGIYPPLPVRKHGAAQKAGTVAHELGHGIYSGLDEGENLLLNPKTWEGKKFRELLADFEAATITERPVSDYAAGFIKKAKESLANTTEKSAAKRKMATANNPWFTDESKMEPFAELPLMSAMLKSDRYLTEKYVRPGYAINENFAEITRLIGRKRPPGTGSWEDKYLPDVPVTSGAERVERLYELRKERPRTVDAYIKLLEHVTKTYFKQ